MTKFESSEMAEYAFNFWFSDQNHIRSPFPDYIQQELKRTTTVLFENWLNGLNMDASEDVDDEVVAEKFEQLLFESALPLIKTDDERISILYPFLPRLDDTITDENAEESVIVNRYLHHEGDTNFLKVTCERKIDKERWTTSFELTI